jgi:hypothetical protein
MSSLHSVRRSRVTTRVGGITLSGAVRDTLTASTDVSGRMQGKINGGGTSVRLATDVGGVSLSSR